MRNILKDKGSHTGFIKYDPKKSVNCVPVTKNNMLLCQKRPVDCIPVKNIQ